MYNIHHCSSVNMEVMVKTWANENIIVLKWQI